MSYRRPIPRRFNSTYVPPSRHTIFIRGLPGSTNVESVKNHFCQESDSKCTVEFFSTSDDKVKFSVAIRFKSHELAREMLERYNGKELLGHPVEVTWFKDLKKARARAFEEHHGRFRAPRTFRGSRGYQDRRSHGRERSYSGGPPSNRRGSRGPSRSSHSSSYSRSISPKRRRYIQDGENDSISDRRRTSRRSRSVSSRSRSSHSGSIRSYHSNHAAAERSGQSRSPSQYSNAPAPSQRENNDNGLLNNLIQLQSKKSNSKPSQYRDSRSRSRSVSSVHTQSTSSPKRRQSQRHRSPVLPTLVSSKDASPEKSQSSLPNSKGNNWRPLLATEETSETESGVTSSKRSLFAAYGTQTSKNTSTNGERPTYNSGKIILSPLVPQKTSTDVSQVDMQGDSISQRTDDRGGAGWKRWREVESGTSLQASDTTATTSNSNSRQQDMPSSKSKDALILEKKAIIEEEYKKECETFAAVAKMFISKDSTLEEKLLPLLKAILHERGQQSIEELRVYIDSLEVVDGRA